MLIFERLETPWHLGILQRQCLHHDARQSPLRKAGKSRLRSQPNGKLV